MNPLKSALTDLGLRFSALTWAVPSAWLAERRASLSSAEVCFPSHCFVRADQDLGRHVGAGVRDGMTDSTVRQGTVRLTVVVGNKFVRAGESVVVADSWLDGSTRVTLVLPGERDVWRLDMEHVLYFESSGVALSHVRSPGAEQVDVVETRTRAIAELRLGIGALRQARG